MINLSAWALDEAKRHCAALNRAGYPLGAAALRQLARALDDARAQGKLRG